MGFQSLYIGATGLMTHGEKMSVIGNNLANVNTIGFKGSDARFQNLLSETVTGGNTTVKGLNQVGMGAGLASITGDYRQGAIEPGSYATDLAVGGKGYFRIVDDEGEIHYTRAGNFRFDKSGFLRDPNGFVLQGQVITDGVNGATGNLQLDLNENNQVVTEAKATSLATMVMNLSADTDNTANAANPFFGLMQSWNGNSDTPLTDGSYDYVNSITIYDDQGGAHVLNVYFDGTGVSGPGGEQYVEFVAGVSPDEDGRAAFAGTSGAGLLMAGVLTFNAAGQLVDMSTYSRSDTASAGSGIKAPVRMGAVHVERRRHAGHHGRVRGRLGGHGGSHLHGPGHGHERLVHHLGHRRGVQRLHGGNLGFQPGLHGQPPAGRPVHHGLHRQRRHPLPDPGRLRRGRAPVTGREPRGHPGGHLLQRGGQGTHAGHPVRLPQRIRAAPRGHEPLLRDPGLGPGRGGPARPGAVRLHDGPVPGAVQRGHGPPSSRA